MDDMELLHNIVNLFLLLAGISLILWGKELFRLKLFAFLISGIATALAGLIIFWSLGIESRTICIIIGLILFVVGGILSMHFYKYSMVLPFFVRNIAGKINMVSYFLGAQAIFIVMFSPYFASYDGPEITLERISKAGSENMGNYLFIIALFTLFGIYFHRKKAIRENDNEEHLQNRLRFRKTVYLCAGWAVFNYFMLIFSRYPTIFEINIINWPIIAVVFFWFIKWLSDGGYKHSFIHNDKWAKFVYLIGFGLIALPIVSCLIMFINFKLLPMHIPRSHLYHSFAFYPCLSFEVRSAFSVVALSILAYDFLLKKQKLKILKAAPVGANITYVITGMIIGGIAGLIVGPIVFGIIALIYSNGSSSDSNSLESVGLALSMGMIMGFIVLAYIGGKVALLLQGRKDSK